MIHRQIGWRACLSFCCGFSLFYVSFKISESVWASMIGWQQAGRCQNTNEDFSILGVRGDKGDWHQMKLSWLKWKQNSRRHRTVCGDQEPASIAGLLRAAVGDGEGWICSSDGVEGSSFYLSGSVIDSQKQQAFQAEESNILRAAQCKYRL